MIRIGPRASSSTRASAAFPSAVPTSLKPAAKTTAGLSSAEVGTATRAEQSVLVSPATRKARSSSIHPHPVSSMPTEVTVPLKTMVSPGKTEPFIRNFIRPKRAVGPSQSVTYRSNQAAWFGVLRKMSLVPLRCTAKL